MENTIEWAKCLLSPKYAKHTYLRIDKKHEQELLHKLTIAVIGIGIAAILMGFFAAYRFGEYMQTKRLVGSKVYQIQIQNSPTTPEKYPILVN